MIFGDTDIGRGIYFIGIGGISMSALALLLHARGYPVRGSDAVPSAITERLIAAGIPVSIGCRERIEAPVVVYTGAIGESHPQYVAAREAGKRLIPRAELLGMVAEEFPHVISVAGCHGKTTATCMLAHIFHENGVAFTSHIGGEDLDLGNIHVEGSEYFLTEACEFKRSFLALRSEIAVILNCDRDHTDCYKFDGELQEAYRAFASQAQHVIVNADDPHARDLAHVVDFGLYDGHIRAEKLQEFGEKYAFTVTEGGLPVVRIRLNVVGRVHIYNALAAFAAARLVGCSPEQIKRGLEAFRGVRRRFEQVGTIGGVPVICDYAHHPREISASLETAERLCRGTVRLVFQPHTYTRTRDLLDDFVRAIGVAEAPILYKTYSAREAFDYAGSAVRLAGLIPDARYVQSPQGLRARLLEHLSADDLILVLGAGDIYDIARGIVDA